MTLTLGSIIFSFIAGFGFGAAFVLFRQEAHAKRAFDEYWDYTIGRSADRQGKS